MPKVLMTGAAGLVGVPAAEALERTGFEVRRFDLKLARGEGQGDIRSPEQLRAAIDGCDGVVHLAAVSRVAASERDPGLCADINVQGTKNVLAAAGRAKRRPWVIFASSREVYGRVDRLPVDESFPLAPANVYGHSKAAGERLMALAAREGCRTAILRLANVYGRVEDHPDRVVPAFARAAVLNSPMWVRGWKNTFDFTHTSDVARGLQKLALLMQGAEGSIPPVHLVTGRPTSLGDLALLVRDVAESDSRIEMAPEPDFNVSHFVGDPRRAASVLQWRATVPIEVGVRRLVDAFEKQLARPVPHHGLAIEAAF